MEELLGRWREYLVGERGLTAGTAGGYVDFVRPFVATRLRGTVLDLDGITAGDVIGFVVSACPGRALGSAKLIVCALRSLLRWLHLTGQVPISLAAAVPAVAGWRLASLPKGLEAGQLRRMLAGCDRRTCTGRRDYAVVLLLSRLGLRAGEVARLGLEDIDWRRGEITITGKGNRGERLPLPADVGAAITAYLRRGRPATAEGRSVFVRVHAPHRALTAGGVTMVVFDAARRAGLGRVHAHRLRHTAATAMLRAGSPQPEVGQVLRHLQIALVHEPAVARRVPAGPGGLGEQRRKPLHPRRICLLWPTARSELPRAGATAPSAMQQSPNTTVQSHDPELRVEGSYCVGLGAPSIHSPADLR